MYSISQKFGHVSKLLIGTVVWTYTSLESMSLQAGRAVRGKVAM